MQLPQWAGVVSGVSQPAPVVQSPNPVLQEETSQVPLAQLAEAVGRLQVMPHPPQFAFVLVGVSHPSVSAAPVEQLA